MDTDSQSSKPPLPAIALLAAAALAYEVLLTRLFAIVQWHHFAYMVISLALLGYGASGSFLALIGRHVMGRFRFFFAANAALFGITAAAAFLLAQQLPFNALEIAWNPWQFAYLAAMYLLLVIPFFCVANCFGLSFLVWKETINRIYAWDLAGAGGGALLVILLLFMLPPLGVLWLLAGIGLSASVWVEKRIFWLALLCAVLVILLPERWRILQISPYKGYSQASMVVGAESLIERSGPLGLLQVLRNDQVPFRYAPGLSLAAPQGPGDQLALFSDGETLGAISRFNGDFADFAYLDYLSSALPYHLLKQPKVVILGAGGGQEIVQALYHGAQQVDAVELNPQIVALLGDELQNYAGDLYQRDNVRVQIAEGRAFIATTDQSYDLIQIALLDAFSTSTAGLYALSESYLYTIEALQDYLAHLHPEGLLAITRWLKLPPRDSLKLFATALVALERSGVEAPARHLVLIRGWKTTTLLVKKSPFRTAELATVREFCRQRSFDTAYYPAMPATEANRFNVLQEPYLYQAALALAGPQRTDFYRRYKFDIRPASDDRPYFFNFFKWSAFDELLSLRAGAGFAQLEWGYLVLLVTLIQALLAALLLIPLPLWLSGGSGGTSGDLRLLLYFSAIGLGFLFLEIAFIQQFVLYLGHPLYAVAVVLAAFLAFAGLGSRYSERLPASRLFIATVISTLAVSYLWLLPILFGWTLAWPAVWKTVLSLSLIAPLAFCMGMPFPLGLQRTPTDRIPWAWAINGCASVISAVLAAVLAVEVGFSGVVLLAAGLYLLAGIVYLPVNSNGHE